MCIYIYIYVFAVCICVSCVANSCVWALHVVPLCSSHDSWDAFWWLSDPVAKHGLPLSHPWAQRGQSCQHFGGPRGSTVAAVWSFWLLLARLCVFLAGWGGILEP